MSTLRQYQQEQFEYTKGVMRVRKLKDGQHIGKQEKGQKTIYKTLRRKLKIEPY